MTQISGTHQGSKETDDKNTIRPFHFTVPEADLTELRRRINATKWPERETVTDASQGVQLATTQALARHWATEYDWRKVEARLNALPQFITEIDGLDIHFIHVRSKHENALPLIVTHGWPGSIIEQMKIVDPLTNPTAHGGNESDAFHLVIPSMPGYGYSGKPTTTGWDVAHIARAWVVLMKRLGYSKFVAQGGDWGAVITEQMVCRHRRSCSAFIPTCPASFQTTSTRRLFPGRRHHRVSQLMRRSPTSVCSLSIKKASPTGSRWDCDRRRYTESRTHPSAWRLISSITTRAATS
jgi:pimeloyl-ACP methyl ester carboxylesterase